MANCQGFDIWLELKDPKKDAPAKTHSIIHARNVNLRTRRN